MSDLKMAADFYEADLWTQVYMEHLKRDECDSTCALCSNIAVRQMRRFFKEDENESTFEED